MKRLRSSRSERPNAARLPSFPLQFLSASHNLVAAALVASQSNIHFSKFKPASPLLTAQEALALAEDSGAAAIFLGIPAQEERKRFSHLSVFDSVEARRLAAECAPAGLPSPTAHGATRYGLSFTLRMSSLHSKYS
jgi:hypothetical protein